MSRPSEKVAATEPFCSEGGRLHTVPIVLPSDPDPPGELRCSRCGSRFVRTLNGYRPARRGRPPEVQEALDGLRSTPR